MQTDSNSVQRRLRSNDRGVLSFRNDSTVSSTEAPHQESNYAPLQTNRPSLSRSIRQLGPLFAVVCADNGRDSRVWTTPKPEGEVKLRQELLSYMHFDESWDGEGAERPSEQAVRDALTFLDYRPADITLPYPEVGTEGDVGVYWDYRNDHVFAEVTFEGDGTYSYFAICDMRDSKEAKCGQDGVSVTSDWPKDMLNILRPLSPI